MLTQAVRAAKDERLPSPASAYRPLTLRRMRWTTTLIKQLVPRIL